MIIGSYLVPPIGELRLGATSHSAALKWACERERWLILHGHARG
ncbi:MAG: hypothetical protein R3B09_27655 [Nannocystaceae bacterium]